MRAFLQELKCAYAGRRCLFCDTEVCAVWPGGNPYISSEYRKNMESAMQKGYRP